MAQRARPSPAVASRIALAHAAFEPVDARLFLALPITILTVQLVWGGIDLLLATSLDRITAGSAVITYGWITGIASLCALAAHPLAGAASDRTPARFGRRSSWVVGGAVCSTLGLVALGQAAAVPAIGASYVVAFGCLPLMLVPLYASIPDRVASDRRGTIGAIVGAATIAGGVIGNVLAARLAGSREVGTAVFAAVLLVGAAAFAIIGREQRAADRTPDHLRAIVQASAAARRTDFAWIAIGRFALFLAYAAVTGLVYYVLRDFAHGSDPAGGVALFAIVSGATTFASSLGAGPLSDRIGQRRPFVATAGLLLGLGALVPIAWPTVGGVLLGAAVLGLGFGTYLSVGTALATLVLPSTNATGRDLGIIGFANAAAQALAPILGSYAASTLGYPALLAGAALASLAAAATVVPIRSVR